MQVRDGRLVAGNGRTLEGDVELVDAVRDIGGGTATLFRGDLRLSTSVRRADGTRAVGTHLARGPAYDATLKDGRTFRGEVKIFGTSYYAVYEPLKDRAGVVVGILHVGVKKAVFLAMLADVERVALLAGSTLIGIGGLVLFLSVRRARRPLDLLCHAMGAIASGRLDVTVPATHRVGEVGRMAKAVLVFKEHMIRAERLAAEQSSTKATAEATAEQKAMRESTAHKFEDRIGGLAAKLSDAALGLRRTASSMSGTAARTGQQASTVASATEQARAGVESVAAAAEELASSISEIGRQIARSST